MGADDALDHVTSPDATPPERASSAGSERSEDERGLVGQTVGSYRVTGKLGRGSVGVVYAAQHQTIGGRVAIKVLDTAVADSPVVVGRFEQEARAANKVANAHIARALDFGQLADGRHYAIYEYVEGPPLEQALQKGSMEVARAIEIARQVAGAMSAAHAVGVVHRDLKPANLLLEAKPELGGEFVRVLDFGVAKLLGDAQKTNYTAAGVFIGTPRYCAPEQLTGEWPIGPAADIYALGAVLYEMLAGQPAFRGRLADIAIKKSRREVEPLKTLRPGLSEDLYGLVDQMLDPSPHARPPSMHDVSRTLTEIRTRGGAVRWKRWGVVAASAVALFAGTFLFVRWRVSAGPEPSNLAEGSPPRAAPPILPIPVPAIPEKSLEPRAPRVVAAPAVALPPQEAQTSPTVQEQEVEASSAVPAVKRSSPRVKRSAASVGREAARTKAKEEKKEKDEMEKSKSVDIVNPFSPRKDTLP